MERVFLSLSLLTFCCFNVGRVKLDTVFMVAQVIECGYGAEEQFIRNVFCIKETV